MSIKNAFTALLEKHTGRSAPEEEVTWRNGVCEACPRRRAPKTRLERTMVRVEGIPGETVFGDVCDVCSCSLGLLNTATENSLPTDPEELAARPDSCWIHQAIS